MTTIGRIVHYTIGGIQCPALIVAIHDGNLIGIVYWTSLGTMISVPTVDKSTDQTAYQEGRWQWPPAR